ncbi:1-aminocyclopropane-1-carboxylate deaminase/D-cysteine desulfhydrase [Sphingobacterium sp. Mn56C]|uniref:1-aminocyclopropane-1-carboxylate deaminase/D-cysteine desulfhydrase n=1 Tax=Sphingobacterium sp. Mn56C TaxID=3395261 RepID=UPI003BBF0DC9
MRPFDYHSPEQEIYHPLYQQKSVRVFSKRDDMIHPFISGNKWRKLKYNLLKAEKEGKSHLLTFGGAWSNHLLATACAAATFQLRATAFVRGEDVRNPVLDMCRIFGMNLIFVDREAYRNKALLFQNLPHTQDYYFIDEGGAGPEAILGCKEIIPELQQEYDHIFCAAGTGTTAAGLATGLSEQCKSSRLHVVPVLKGGAFIGEELLAHGVDMRHTQLHTDYHFGGYAKTKPELIQFIKEYVATTGLLIEPTYTGKAMFALHSLLAADKIAPNSRVLFLHTGGLTGLLGMLDRF